MNINIDSLDLSNGLESVPVLIKKSSGALTFPVFQVIIRSVFLSAAEHIELQLASVNVVYMFQQRLQTLRPPYL